MQVLRILGIDPGSRLTGYGCIDVVGNQIRHVTHGTLRLSNTGGRAVIALQQRLLSIYEGLSEIIETHRPQVMSVERVFFAKNAVSALKLGQARGATILTGMIHSLQIVEYSPTEVKATLVGHGQADKDQVARMVSMLIGRKDFATNDASDGLALAICHALVVGAHKDKSSIGALDSYFRAGKRKKRATSLAEAIGIGAESIENIKIKD
jgi:crossover junction endodeoxyribonuclease RuvC